MKVGRVRVEHERKEEEEMEEEQNNRNNILPIPKQK